VFVNAQQGGLWIYEQHGHAAGQLLDGAHLPLALPGVKISAGGDLSTTTNISGSFDLRSLPIGLSTITPTLDGYAFVPPRVTLQTPSAYQGALNFVTLIAPQAITLTPGVTATLAYTEPNGATRGSVPADTQLNAVDHVDTDVGGRRPRSWFTGHAFDLATSSACGPISLSRPVTISLHYADRRDRSQRQARCTWRGNGTVDRCGGHVCARTNYTRELDANTIA
jgi:hypothetical protein